jgi:hypothetical protein
VRTKKYWNACGHGTLPMPNIKSAVGEMARLTGLEPATSGVTGRHSNQLSYNRAVRYSSTDRFPG